MSLLAPAFLFGLVAIGLPLWLHRLSAENPNKQQFSSLMFLEPGEPRRVLARKLQYLLLLALRIGVLVLLALAFAQPTLWRTPSAAGTEGARLHLIVLDTSASMGYAGTWQRARDAAAAVIGALGPEDRAQVIAAGRSLQVLGAATNDKSALRQTLNTLEPGVFRIDYGQVMRSLDGLVRSADLPVVIDIVTDAQQSSLPTRFGELAPRAAATLDVHDVAAAAPENWVIESFGGSALTGELVASVRSFANEAAEKTLKLTQNGKPVGEKTVQIPAHGRVDVQFDALELAPGGNRVVVALTPDDDLPVDDQRFLALRRAQPRPVMLLAADQRGRGALFANAALATLTNLALTPETHSLSDFTKRPLSDYSLIVVTDVGLIGPDEAAQLRDYVQKGGGLLLACGPRSTSMTSVPITGEVLGGAATAALGPRAALSIGEIDATHPALKGLNDLRSAQFYRYLPITPGADDRVLVKLDDGSLMQGGRRDAAGVGSEWPQDASVEDEKRVDVHVWVSMRAHGPDGDRMAARPGPVPCPDDALRMRLRRVEVHGRDVVAIDIDARCASRRALRRNPCDRTAGEPQRGTGARFGRCMQRPVVGTGRGLPVPGIAIADRR